MALKSSYVHSLCTRKLVAIIHPRCLKNKMQSKTADFAPGAATWRTVQNIRVVFDSVLFPALYEYMTSSTKPEVHNVSHGRQRRTEPRPQTTCAENLVKFRRVIFEIRERIDRQTNSYTYGGILTSVGWQVALCDPTRHASFQYSGEA